MDSPPRRAPAFSIDEFGQLVSSALESQEHFKPTLDFAFMEPRYSESRFSLDTLDSDPTDVFASSNTRPEAPRKLFRSLRALVTGKRATEPPYRSPVVVSRDVDPFTQSTHSSAFVPYGVPYHDGLEDYPPPSPTLFARSCASPDSFEELDRRASVHSDSSACATSSLSTAGSSSACTDRSAPPLSPLFFAPSDPDATRRAYSDLGHGTEERAAEFDADPFAKDTVQIMPRTPPRRVARHPRSEPPPRLLPKRTPPPMSSPPACPLPGMPHGGCGDWTLSLPLPAPAPLEEVHARADVNAALNRDLTCSRWFPSPPPSPSPPARRRGALRPSTSSGALETSTPSRLRGSSSALSLPPPIMRRPSRASSTTSSKKRVAFAVEVITPVQELKAPTWEPSSPPESIRTDPVVDDDDDDVPLQQLVQALEGVAVRRSAEIASMLDSAQMTAVKAPSVTRLTDEDSARRPDSPFPLLQPKRSKPEVSSPSSSTPTPPSSGSKLTRSKPPHTHRSPNAKVASYPHLAAKCRIPSALHLATVTSIRTLPIWPTLIPHRHPLTSPATLESRTSHAQGRRPAYAAHASDTAPDKARREETDNTGIAVDGSEYACVDELGVVPYGAVQL
ncbi:uncharacterized protein SCHCODRAFT_02753796 [Schizophyllum commune H4-8]|uniref:Uncharacterized protein n=1 Tax=Schizophyllum commune (strain H4-8 / FGSC 9210) TaxID=578458 RepID=D8QKH3_SCHCM|nr:uncharacterized protein SCHCODRAFT_02753796 [Schizophyllum commune H4-8]KAI5885112.1 hypothetical protein SCHCODRAFT_02753796 [Schizophyllum commune H4-8]